MLSILFAIFLFSDVNAYHSAVRHHEPITNDVFVENNTGPKTFLFHEDTPFTHYGSVFSLARDERATISLHKNGFSRKIEILGKKEKIRARNTGYFTSELLLEMRYKVPILYYKHSRTFTIINQTEESQDLIFTYVRGRCYQITIRLKPKESIQIPYRKGAMRKRIGFINCRERIRVKRDQQVFVSGSKMGIIS
jgi:hypothetical protein